MHVIHTAVPAPDVDRYLVRNRLLPFVCLLFSLPLMAQDDVPSGIKLQLAEQPDYWYNGDRKQALWRARNEQVIHTGQQAPRSPQALIPGTNIIDSNAGWTLVRLNQDLAARKTEAYQAIQPMAQAPVVTGIYYDTKTGTGRRYIETDTLLVHFKAAQTSKQVRLWGQQRQLQLKKTLKLDHAYLFQCQADRDCLSQANQAYRDPQVKYAYPNWIRPKIRRHNAPLVLDDPLFPEQWHLDNTGQNQGTPGEDLNALSAWSHGHGTHAEIIAIVDDGVDIAHPDLAANLIPGLSRDFVDNDEDPTDIEQSHGTGVAGIAVARGGNAVGVSGVAPHAGLAGLRLINGGESIVHEAIALTYRSDQIDIYNNSWGPSDDVHLEGPGPLVAAALLEGVQNGRQGKGAIYVWAAGNGGERRDNSNYDGYANSPYTIAVAATTHNGKRANYSEKGANLWVNAPSSGDLGAMLTTDQSGKTGASNDDYNRNFGGTSAAAPEVAGVAALILQQNPELGWRDVQQILATSAERNDPGDSDWSQNAAGHWINHLYGFGRVDANAAVTAATQWRPVAEQTRINATQTLNQVAISSDPAHPTTARMTLRRNLSIEYVNLHFHSDHPYWGDLGIKLISPSGTVSTLAESNGSGEGPGYAGGWRFGIARLLGEQAQGVWRLQVSDEALDKDSGHLTEWSLEVHGTAAPAPVESGTTGIDHNWRTIPFKHQFADPVVIVSPLSFNGGQPAVTRLQAVASGQFQLRVQEWPYLDQWHNPESVAYLVLEKGRHTFSDGSVWEVGSFNQAGTRQWQVQPFQAHFAHPPRVFLSPQTANEAHPVVARVSGIDHDQFHSALFEEEARNGAVHGQETIGYLAIGHTADHGSIPVNHTATDYTLKTVPFSHRWAVASPEWVLKVEEEQSADTEVQHKHEDIAILTFEQAIFAQDISSYGDNPAALRVIQRRLPAPQ